MSVGLLLVTHRPLGGDLLRIASEILGNPPQQVQAMEVVNDTPLEELLDDCLTRLNALDEGEGVLILTDLFGATPGNVAVNAAKRRDSVRVVSGINLPMVLRAINYATLALDEVVEKALQGGREGVRLCEMGQ